MSDFERGLKTGGQMASGQAKYWHDRAKEAEAGAAAVKRWAKEEALCFCDMCSCSGCGAKHAPCPKDSALSSPAGQSILEELERLRKEAARFREAYWRAIDKTRDLGDQLQVLYDEKNAAERDLSAARERVRDLENALAEAPASCKCDLCNDGEPAAIEKEGKSNG